MSDRIKGFYVVLDSDIKDEDFKDIENAVIMLKGVIKIKRDIVDSNDFLNRERIKRELTTKLFKILE